MVSRKILDQFFPESGGSTYMWVIIFLPVDDQCSLYVSCGWLIRGSVILDQIGTYFCGLTYARGDLCASIDGIHILGKLFWYFVFVYCIIQRQNAFI